MITFLPLDAPLSSGVPLTIDETDRALGHIPGWSTFIDPEYPAGTGMRNRARAASVMTPATPWDGTNFSVFPNGETAMVRETSFTKALPATAAVNANEWSFFTVINDTPAGSVVGSREIIRPVEVTGTGRSPHIVLRSAQQISLYNSDYSVERLTIANAAPSGQTSIVLFTFSTRDGLRAYRNGVLAASNAADKNPLDDQYGVGEYVFLRRNLGTGSLKYGMTGVLNIDLGWLEHEGYRDSLHSFLKEKYGVA